MEAYVLLVEDDPDDVELTLAALRAEGFKPHVEVAKDGAEAVERLRRAKEGGGPLPAAVVLDLKLPKMGGLDVLRWMLETAGLSVPVAILTSSSYESDRAEAARLGVSAYLLKPTSLSGYSAIAAKLQELVAAASRR